MLFFDPLHFTYHNGIMEVEDTRAEGYYKLAITPIERICSDATKAELRAKTNN
jgi:hypothetical protein